MLTLRCATLEDAPEIAEVYIRTRRVAYAPFFPPLTLAAMSLADETLKWHRRIDDMSAETVVALDMSGTIAGFTQVSWHDTELHATGEVDFMYVATEHQGNGLGSLLMGEAESRLAAQGLVDAVLWVYEANSLARGFYERCGWSDDGARRTSESAPGQHLARYRKHLGSRAASITEAVRLT